MLYPLSAAMRSRVFVYGFLLVILLAVGVLAGALFAKPEWSLFLRPAASERRDEAFLGDAGMARGGCCLPDLNMCVPSTLAECAGPTLSGGDWQEGGDMGKCTRDLCCVTEGGACDVDGQCCGGLACDDGACRQAYCCVREFNGDVIASADPEYFDEDGVADCRADPAKPGVAFSLVTEAASCARGVYCCNPRVAKGDGEGAPNSCTPQTFVARGPNPCAAVPYDGIAYTDAADCQASCGQSFVCVHREAEGGGIAPTCEREPRLGTFTQRQIDEAPGSFRVVDATDPDAVQAWIMTPYLPASDRPEQDRRFYDCEDWCGGEAYAAACGRWCADESAGGRQACREFCPGFAETGTCEGECAVTCRERVCLDAFKSAAQCQSVCMEAGREIWDANIGGGGMRNARPWPGFPNILPGGW
jgi:hypothetical protein